MSVNNLKNYTANKTFGNCLPTLVNNLYVYFNVPRRFSAQELLNTGYLPGNRGGIWPHDFFDKLHIKYRFFNRVSRYDMRMTESELRNKWISQIKNSLDAGHPVAIVSQSLATPPSSHIYLLVGYNRSETMEGIFFLTINRHQEDHDLTWDGQYTDCFSESDSNGKTLDSGTILWISENQLAVDLGVFMGFCTYGLIYEILSVPVTPQQEYAPISSLRPRLKSYVLNKYVQNAAKKIIQEKEQNSKN
jgi:hypothetical protein